MHELVEMNAPVLVPLLPYTDSVADLGLHKEGFNKKEQVQSARNFWATPTFDCRCKVVYSALGLGQVVDQNSLKNDSR